MVALVAHEASPTLGDVTNSAPEIGLRGLRLHVPAERVLKLSDLSRPSRFPALLGIAQSAQVDVLDSDAG